jgi:hypothetical protein
MQSNGHGITRNARRLSRTGASLLVAALYLCAVLGVHFAHTCAHRACPEERPRPTGPHHRHGDTAPRQPHTDDDCPACTFLNSSQSLPVPAIAPACDTDVIGDFSLSMKTVEAVSLPRISRTRAPPSSAL